MSSAERSDRAVRARGDIELKIYTFQLDPTTPTQVTPTLEYLATKYGTSSAQAWAMEEGMAK